jgi:hypothetical protein
MLPCSPGWVATAQLAPRAEAAVAYWSANVVPMWGLLALHGGAASANRASRHRHGPIGQALQVTTLTVRP